MRNAASRCIRRGASFALLAFVAFAATVLTPSADSASKKVLSGTTAITVTQASDVSLSISWQRVRSAAGYDAYLGGVRVAKTQGTAYTFANLRCDSTYTLGVDAFTVKGVSSSIVSLAARTSACPVAAGGNDTSPPTSPTSLTQGATTATTISLLWSASLDNVGVAGYDLFLNGNKAGTTTATNYSFANLSCGTSYTLAVDAYDAAGNRSQSAAVQASTSPCPDTSPPTTPGLPTQSGSTATTISLLWGASLDNVAVAGYDLFLNGNKAGTTTATSYTFPNLSCGTSYTLAVDAYDAAGNRSQPAVVDAATSPCAASGTVVNCDIVANPGAGTAQQAIDKAQGGQTVCLHGGTYTASVQIALNKSNVTLESYPGEMAVVGRGFQLGCGSCSGSTLRDFTIQDATNYGENGIDVDGANMRIEHMQIIRTGQHNIILHSDTSNAVVTRNYAIDAGMNSSLIPSETHGIYVTGHDNQITDNVFVSPTGYGIHVYGTNHDETIAENTVIGSKTRGGIVVDVGTGYNIKVANNISYGNATGGYVLKSCASGCVFDHLLGFNNVNGTCTDSLAGQATHCVTADPQFIDGQYHVAPSSPAVDAATPNFMASPDRDGVVRDPVAPDLGAYER
jgi:chitodextrinase